MCKFMSQKAEKGHCGLQIGPKYLHKHPKWSRLIFGKIVFWTCFSLEMAHFQMCLGCSGGGGGTAHHGLKAS